MQRVSVDSVKWTSQSFSESYSFINPEVHLDKMKKSIAALLLICLFSITSIACGEEHPITIDKLPQTAQQFIKTHFATLTVSNIMADHDSFDVVFSNGYKVEFDKKGEWEDVDCQRDEVPGAIIPTAIKNYVSTNYGGNIIVEISKDNRKYDVELNNGLDLEFDKSGNFLRIDD